MKNKKNRTILFIALIAITAFITTACPESSDNGNKGRVDKTGLEAKIADAQDAMYGVSVSNNGADVPSNYFWVTQAALNNFNGAIADAKTVLNTGKTQTKIDSAVSVLDDAITVFNNAKAKGTAQASVCSIRITGLESYEGKYVNIGLVSNYDDYIVGNPFAIMGSGYINNGEITADLYTRENNNDIPWTGGGIYYIGYYIQTNYNGMPFEFWHNNTTYNFDTNPVRTAAHSNFTQMTVFSITIDQCIKALTENAGSFEDSLGVSARWEDFVVSVSSAENFTEWEAMMVDSPYQIYQDSALSVPFKADTIIFPNTRIFSTGIFWMYSDNDDTANTIGYISGTISLTNIPPGAGVYISANGASTIYGKTFFRSKTARLTGLTAGSVFNIPFSIALREHDFFRESSDEQISPYQNWDITFRLYIEVDYNTGYEISIPDTKDNINIPEIDDGTFNVSVGSLGDPVNLAYVTIGGTINITCDNNPVNYLWIDVRIDKGDFLGSSSLNLTASNKTWKVIIPDSDTSRNLYVNIYGFPNNKYDWNKMLFRISNYPIGELQPNTGDTNIMLEIGNVDSDSGLGESYIKIYKYKLNGTHNVLTFNPMERGNGTRAYTPDDDECDKWNLIQSTKGEFPAGKWESESNSSDEYITFTEWVEFGSGKTYTFYHYFEYNSSFTHTSTNASSGVITYSGYEIPYVINGNKLICNLIRSGDGIKHFTPEDPQCPKYILKDGTGGEFPAGIWEDEYSSISNKSWYEFKEDNTLIRGRKIENKGTYSINDTAITIVYNN